MAGRGGARPGAGRKAGAKWFSRRINESALDRLAELSCSGRDPLEALIGFAFDKSLKPELRIQAASAATPFLHPKLTSATVQSTTTNLHAEVDQAQLMATLEERINRVRQPALDRSSFLGNA